MILKLTTLGGVGWGDVKWGGVTWGGVGWYGLDIISLRFFFILGPEGCSAPFVLALHGWIVASFKC